MMHGREKSDSAIVAGKPTNKAVSTAAEPVERRAEAKGNTGQSCHIAGRCRFASRLWNIGIRRSPMGLRLSDGKGLPHPQTRIGQAALRPMERRGFRRARQRRSGRPHLQGQWCAGRKPVDVDAGLRAPRRSHANPRTSRASSLLKADLFPTRADQIKAPRVLRNIGVTIGRPLCFRRAMLNIEVIGQSDHWGV
jgi:hypothetical protein